MKLKMDIVLSKVIPFLCLFTPLHQQFNVESMQTSELGTNNLVFFTIL